MKKYDVNLMMGHWLRHRININSENEMMDALDYFKIDRAVAYHSEARIYSPPAGNAKILELSKKHDRIIPCFVVSPHYNFYPGGMAGLKETLMKENIKFARIFPKEQGYTLESGWTKDILNILKECGINLILEYNDIFEDKQYERRSFEDLVEAYPDVNFILTGVIHRRNMMFYRYISDFPNVYLETSIIDNWRFYEETVRLYGSGRLLWGSYLPFKNAGSSITMLSYADIPESDRENVAYKNLLKMMER